MSERTLAIIKPDVVSMRKIGAVISMYEEEAGLKIVDMKVVTPVKSKWQDFYAEHASKPFFHDLLDAMTSGISIALVLEGENAVATVRRLNGATKPSEAAPGTIRKLYGTAGPRNAVHGSDSAERRKVRTR
jgi:nucleoside-diphosphate kinase